MLVLLISEYKPLSDDLTLELRIFICEIVVSHLLLEGCFQVVKLDAAGGLAVLVGDTDLPLEFGCLDGQVFTIKVSFKEKDYSYSYCLNYSN